MKYLDIHNIPNNSSSTELDILSNDTQRLALRIAARRASSIVKALVYNQYVLPRIRNHAPHLTSSLERLRGKIDQPEQRLLRKTMPSFPAKLLHIPRKVAGLGLKCPTDIIQL